MLTYPHTRIADLVDSYFGATVKDPYRWLENDVREDEELSLIHISEPTRPY